MIPAYTLGDEPHCLLHSDQLQIRIDSPDISRIARYDNLTRPSRADYDVGINDIGGCSLRQQKPDSGRVRPVQWDQVGAGLADQA